MEDMTTTDLARFGSRELRMARDLLIAYCDGDRNRTEYLGDGVTIMFNRNSGCVFLTDEDYNVAMTRDGDLIDWRVCSYCGHEDFADEIAGDEDHGINEDGEILCRDEGTYPPVDEDSDEDSDDEENDQ